MGCAPVVGNIRESIKIRKDYKWIIDFDGDNSADLFPDYKTQRPALPEHIVLTT